MPRQFVAYPLVAVVLLEREGRDPEAAVRHDGSDEGSWVRTVVRDRS